VLNVSPFDLINRPGAEISVPVIGRVGFDLAFPNRPAAEEDYWLLPPPGLERAAECFAVAVEDSSANRMYPRGAHLICRRTGTLATPLKRGDKVVIARDDPAGIGEWSFLTGLLDQTTQGDIVLLMRTHDRKGPPSVLIQEGPADGIDRAERLPGRGIVTAADDPTIDYHFHEGDPAEISGKVVFAITPE